VECLKSKAKAQQRAKQQKIKYDDAQPDDTIQMTPELNFWWMAEGRQYIRFFDHESGRHDNIYFMRKSCVATAAALRINATSNISQRIAEKANERKARMLLQDFVPSHYYN